MINVLVEHTLSLEEAAKALPPRKGGKPLCVHTIRKWATVGIKGVVLETVVVGGTTRTSPDALSRFFSELTAASARLRVQRRQQRQAAAGVANG